MVYGIGPTHVVVGAGRLSIMHFMQPSEMPNLSRLTASIFVDNLDGHPRDISTGTLTMSENDITRFIR